MISEGLKDNNTIRFLNLSYNSLVFYEIKEDDNMGYEEELKNEYLRRREETVQS